MSGESTLRLAACTRVIEDYFEQQCTALLDAAREPLIVAARDAGDRDEEDRLLSVLEEVEALVPQATETFRTGLVAGLQGPDALPGDGVAGDPGDGDGLSLVETAKVDDWLRLKALLDRQGEAARNIEAELWERLAALAGVAADPDLSPVSLQCICVQFQAAMQGVAPGRDARAAIYDGFEATVVGNLGHLAARLQASLDGDVAPAPAPPPDAVAPVPPPEDEGDAGAQTPGADVTSPVLEPARVLGAMSAIQRREVESLSASLDDLEERLVESITPRPGMTLDAHERRTVAAVARIVRPLLDEPEIDPAVRRRLLLLTPPLLMLALHDEHYLEAEMYTARHDPVTGLLDRTAFRVRLEAALKRSAAPAVCLVDIDGFDAVAARLGHQVGGRLLRALADMLRKQSGRRNGAARLRGDEFAVLLPAAKAGAGRRFADRFLASLSASRFAFGGEPVELHASVGVVESDAGLASPGDLMRAADAARGVAKAAGGSCVRVHAARG